MHPQPSAIGPGPQRPTSDPVVGDDGLPASDEVISEESSLEDLVYERLSAYVERLQGHAPEDMYRLIMPQLERPLIRVALELSNGERHKAAKMLGIHRNTLRSRIRSLGIEAEVSSPRKAG